MSWLPWPDSKHKESPTPEQLMSADLYPRPEGLPGYERYKCACPTGFCPYHAIMS